MFTAEGEAVACDGNGRFDLNAPLLVATVPEKHSSHFPKIFYFQRNISLSQELYITGRFKIPN
jgi:hypothetical protein